MSWALYLQDKRLLVGKLTHLGTGMTVRINRTGQDERVKRVYVQGVFDSDDQAFAARNAAISVDEWDIVAKRSAIKASPGYRPLN